MRTILVIEDDMIHNLLTQRIIQKIRHANIVLAQDPSDGWCIMRALAKVEAVVCDYQMPFANGMQFIDKLRATPEFAHTPVVLSTGAEAADLPSDLAHLGVALLTKPYQPQDLVDTVMTILGEG